MQKLKINQGQIDEQNLKQKLYEESTKYDSSNLCNPIPATDVSQLTRKVNEVDTMIAASISTLANLELNEREYSNAFETLQELGKRLIRSITR